MPKELCVKKYYLFTCDSYECKAKLRVPYKDYESQSFPAPWLKEKYGWTWKSELIADGHEHLNPWEDRFYCPECSERKGLR